MIDGAFVQSSYLASGPVAHYAQAVRTVGLWQSEETIFRQYVAPADRILDIGCGAGRTTYGLYRLGYRRIQGIDYSPAMIGAAQAYGRSEGIGIPFQVGDATALDLPSEAFDVVLFSFNGLMSIPGAANRLRALAELCRVARPKGLVIFTTHDRDADRRRFWKAEERRWRKGDQNPRLLEYGDILFDHDGAESFIHIPDVPEVHGLIAAAGLEVVDTALRSEIADEAPIVREFSVLCRFWITRRPNHP